MAGNYQPLPPFTFYAIIKLILYILDMKLQPQIILTASGERIIAGVGEYTDENGNKICAVLRSPYIVNLVPFDDGNSEQQQYKVSFTKWIPYSSSKQFRIPFSQIVTIGEVEQDILNLYEQNFGDTDDDTTDGGDAGDNGTSDSSDNAEEPGVSDSTD